MTRCELCFHRCLLSEGQRGFCRARVCRGGKIIDENYGMITSLALDPVEKKPLRRFHPGAPVLSVGSYGCNLRCPFCQNSEISMSDGSGTPVRRLLPEQLAALARELKPRGNLGVAYTYNEPTIAFEYLMDCAPLIRHIGLYNLLVTNGSLLPSPLRRLLPFIDAMNVDLKGFTEEGYRRLGGDLETVKNFIRISAEAGCHVEVTTLIVPGENDFPEEMRALSAWLASIDRRIPLHVTRFFPQYKMSQAVPTPLTVLRRMTDIASEFLEYVYLGNC